MKSEWNLAKRQLITYDRATNMWFKFTFIRPATDSNHYYLGAPKSIYVHCFQGKFALFRWPETAQLNSFPKNGIIFLMFGEGRQPWDILKVGKSTV